MMGLRTITVDIQPSGSGLRATADALPGFSVEAPDLDALKAAMPRAISKHYAERKPPLLVTVTPERDCDAIKAHVAKHGPVPYSDGGPPRADGTRWVVVN